MCFGVALSFLVKKRCIKGVSTNKKRLQKVLIWPNYEGNKYYQAFFIKLTSKKNNRGKKYLYVINFCWWVNETLNEILIQTSQLEFLSPTCLSSVCLTSGTKNSFPKQHPAGNNERLGWKSFFVPNFVQYWVYLEQEIKFVGNYLVYCRRILFLPHTQKQDTTHTCPTNIIAHMVNCKDKAISSSM